MAMLLSTLLKPFDATVLTDVQIDGLAWDSRHIRKGDLFFACEGEVEHGKKYIPCAKDGGAVAIALETDSSDEALSLSERHKIPVVAVDNLSAKLGEIASLFFSRPTASLNLIGITGTNGKTSCSHILAQCLPVPCGVIGTMGAGIWGDLKSVNNTTPGAVELQQWMRELCDLDAKSVVMEVSSHGLEQGRVNGCQFDIAVFTNLTQDHLDYHGTMEQYGLSKLKLFQMESVNSVVVNLDDKFSGKIIDEVKGRKNIIGITLNQTLADDTEIDIISAKSESSLKGTKISIESSFGSSVIDTSLIGEFNVTNLLLVLACSLQLGDNFDQACARLSQVVAPGGRLEKFGGNHLPIVVVDYAHTPDALEKVLQTLKKITKGKLYSLIGCGGDRDIGKRAQMGAIAENYSDLVYVTNDNPRTESPKVIVEHILEGIKDKNNVVVELDREKAIRHSIRQANEHDVVLVAGKGHENYQIIGTERLNFSDREIVIDELGVAA